MYKLKDFLPKKEKYSVVRAERVAFSPIGFPHKKWCDAEIRDDDVYWKNEKLPKGWTWKKKKRE